MQQVMLAPPLGTARRGVPETAPTGPSRDDRAVAGDVPVAERGTLDHCGPSEKSVEFQGLTVVPQTHPGTIRRPFISTTRHQGGRSSPKKGRPSEGRSRNSAATVSR